MNKRNLKNLPPRQFPKRQYMKLTHKIGLIIVIPIITILIGGGISLTLWNHQSNQTHQSTHQSVNRNKIIPKHHFSHKIQLKPLNVKQGEKLLGYWLQKLHYPTEKSQNILSTYQKRNKQRDLKTSKELNQIDHSQVNKHIKTKQIQHFINQDL